MRVVIFLLLAVLALSFSVPQRNLLQEADANEAKDQPTQAAGTNQTKEQPTAEADKDDDKKDDDKKDGDKMGDDKKDDHKSAHVGILIVRFGVFLIVLVNIVKCFNENREKLSGWEAHMAKHRHGILFAAGFGVVVECIDNVLGAFEAGGVYEFGETYERMIMALGYFSAYLLCATVSELYADRKKTIVLGVRFNLVAVLSVTIYLGTQDDDWVIQCLYFVLMLVQSLLWRGLTTDYNTHLCVQISIVWPAILLVAMLHNKHGKDDSTTLNAATLAVKALLLEPLLSLCFDAGNEYKERVKKAATKAKGEETEMLKQ